MDVIKLFFKYSFENGCHLLTVVKKNHAGTLATVSWSYKPMSARTQELQPNVSDAIDFFLEGNQSITDAENNRLERCLSDLLLWQLYPHLNTRGTIILIQGPPFSKLVGRLGYRYPSALSTIAFVTTDDRFSEPPRVGPGEEADWDGPFPHLQEDSITRRYYHLKEPRLRADIFCQNLERYSPLQDDGNIPCGIIAKFRATSALLKQFAEELHSITSEPAPTFDQERAPSLWEPSPPRLALAARLSTPLSDPSTPSLANTSVGFDTRQRISDDEVFDGVYSATRSRTKDELYNAIRLFLHTEGLGGLQDNVRFIRFLKEKGVGNRRAPTTHELVHLFKEFQNPN